jgi:hypothetical protein
MLHICAFIRALAVHTDAIQYAPGSLRRLRAWPNAVRPGKQLKASSTTGL